jgi:hypothetical protein
MHEGGGGKILYLGRRKIDDAIYPADCGKFSLFPSFSLPSSFAQIPDNILKISMKARIITTFTSSKNLKIIPLKPLKDAFRLWKKL